MGDAVGRTVSLGAAPPAEWILPPGEAAGARLPWWAKMAAKLAVSAPAGRAMPNRHRLGIGVHSFAAGAQGQPVAI